MAGIVMNQPSFDYLFMSQPETQNIPDFYPSIADLYSQQADFSTDYATSPESPVSPVFGATANTYSLPSGSATDDWMAWESDKIAFSPQNIFKTEPAFASSPSINPTDLSNEVVVAPFGREGLNDTRPLFVLPSPLSPPMRQSSKGVRGSKASVEPVTEDRHLSSRKRKSSATTTPSSTVHHSQRSTPSTSPSPPPTSERSERKTSSSSAAATSAPRRPKKKTAHNMIEKRYRTNLNDKLALLRDAVPSLRAAHLQSAPARDDDANDDEDDDAAPSSAVKLNKATVLAKAAEYIVQLERRNAALEGENRTLRGRVEGLMEAGDGVSDGEDGW